MLGAVTAFVLGVAVARFAGLYKVSRQIDMPILDALPWRALLRVTLLSAVAGAAAVSATLWLGSPVARVALGGILYLLGYGALVYAVGPVPRIEIRHMVAQFTPARRR